MLFWLVYSLQAGVAGGTGSGAAPVVAELARQQGALTIAMAMLPEHQQHQAEQVGCAAVGALIPRGGGQGHLGIGPSPESTDCGSHQPPTLCASSCAAGTFTCYIRRRSSM